MIPSLKVPVFASSLLLFAAAAGAQTPQLTPQQEAQLKARQEELARQRALVPPVSAGSTAGPIAVAAPASRIAGPIEVTVQNMNENRAVAQGRANVQMSFGFTFNLAGVDPAAVVRRVQINRAIDNQDRPLATIAGRGATAGLVGMAAPGRGPLVLRGNAPLGGPSRDATAIKLLEGEVEIFVPTAENGALIRVPDVATLAGKVIEHPALKGSGIEVTILDRERYAGLGLAGAEPNFATSTVLYVRDPGSLFVRAELQDAAGTPVQAPAQMRPAGVGTMVEIRTPQGPPAGAQLVVYAAVPAAVKIYSFKLENLQLP